MAVSSQGMKDHLGAKSEYVADLSTSFPIFPDPAGQNPGTRLRLLKTCALRVNSGEVNIFYMSTFLHVNKLLSAEL